MRERRKRREKKPALVLRIAHHYGWYPGRFASEVLEWAEVLVVAGALAFLVITFVTVRMHVPTDSMHPTINGDPNPFKADSFFVDKISYYFRFPRPGDIVVFWHTEAVFVKQVKEGSPAARARVRSGDRIVSVNREPVFSAAGADEAVASLADGTALYLGTASAGTIDLGTKSPGTNSLADLGISLREQRARYVKRLIAVGGQTVQVKDGSVYVNGERLKGERFERSYTANDPRMLYGVSPTGPTLVPRGKWFVLGDNSQDSWDSRFWGFVDKRDFIGEPYLRVWPLGRFGPMNGYFHL